jgi:hypothetical protein
VEFGVERERAAEVGDGVGRPARIGAHDPLIREDGWIARLSFRGLVEHTLGVPKGTPSSQAPGQTEMRIGRRHPACDRGTKVRLGRRAAVTCNQRVSEAKASLRVARIVPDDRGEGTLQVRT